MHPIFQITPLDICSLNDKQARELVARLCKAELQSKGVGTNSVTWGGDQRAKDGGVDVRVDVNPTTGVIGYIPKDSTAYQVKAETFNPAKIAAEMAPKGILRPAITEFGHQSGAYIIVSTRDHLSDSSLIARKKAMADCLERYGLPEKVNLDFYDSRKIADWVENFPPIVFWVKRELAKSVEGWQPYGPWAYYETNEADEYLLDDKVKVFTPGASEGVDIVHAINSLRTELVLNGTSARIVGLSGVGKTRFAQALFDGRIATSSVTPSQENVLYTDLSHNPSPQPVAMMEALRLEGQNSLVIVDNCGQETHQILTEIVKRPSSKLRLLTIEYDIRDDIPEGTSCYRLEGSSDEVIEKLLKRRYQTFSDLDVRKIVEFSDGNARVAFALASTSETTGEIAQLADEALFKRLFLQKHSASDELQKCAEIASLLYSFDVVDMSKESELAILAEVAEVTIQTFYRNVVELQRRGLVQERGNWRAVLPHAISNRLAIRAIQVNPTTVLVRKFVLDASDRTARSFSRRLGYLHESKQAQGIAAEWLKFDGLLGDVTKLNELQRRMFENVAPINQIEALNALLRGVTSKDFLSIHNRSRSYFSRLLRSLAYEKEFFEAAAEALLLFALEEPTDYKSDTSCEILKSLFYIQLSGTQATLNQRANFVRRLTLSADVEMQKIGLILLGVALMSNHFSSSHSFEFGALKRDFGWQPKTQIEVKQWYEKFIEIAIELGKSSTSRGTDARSLLGSTFRGLWVYVGVQDVLANAVKEFIAIDGWPDGWIGIRNTLHFDKKIMDDSTLKKLKALEKELAPKDLMMKIRAKVLSLGAFGVDIEDDYDSESGEGRYLKAYEEAVELGKAAAHDDQALADLAPYISKVKSTDKTWSFGNGIGQEASSIEALLNRIRLLIDSADAGTINTLFVRGLIAGWNKTSPDAVSDFLDKAVSDEVWSVMFPELQTSIVLDSAAYSRLIRSIDLDKAPCWQFKYLGFGRSTDPLSVEQIAFLISMLSTKSNSGLTVAIDVLSMVIHCTDAKEVEYQCELRTFCATFVGNLNWELYDFKDQNLPYHLVKIIEFSLQTNVSQDVVFKAITSLFKFNQVNVNCYQYRLGDILLPFFKAFPMKALNACFEQDVDGSYKTVLRTLAVRDNRQGDSAVSLVPQEILIEWCKISSNERCIFAAQTCKIFESSNSNGLDDASPIRLSNTAINVLAIAPDKKKILEIFIERFQPNTWSGSLSSIMRQRFKLLDQLNLNDDAILKNLINDVKDRFLKIILKEEEREQRSERLRALSFE